MISTNLKQKGKERFNIKKLYCKALFVENRKRRATFPFILEFFPLWQRTEQTRFSTADANN